MNPHFSVLIFKEWEGGSQLSNGTYGHVIQKDNVLKGSMEQETFSYQFYLKSGR